MTKKIDLFHRYKLKALETNCVAGFCVLTIGEASILNFDQKECKMHLAFPFLRKQSNLALDILSAR